MNEPATQGSRDSGARIAAEPGVATANASEVSLAVVLARALAALVDATGASRAAAWGRAPDGTLAVLAARVEGATLHPPSDASWSALCALRGPTDLLASGDRALSALAEAHGFLAAAPLPGSDAEPLAVLLVGAPEPGDARQAARAASRRRAETQQGAPKLAEPPRSSRAASRRRAETPQGANELAEPPRSSRAASRRRAETQQGVNELAEPPRSSRAASRRRAETQPRLLDALGAAVAGSLEPAAAAVARERLARADVEMQRLDRLAAVGGLLAEIVHEIRNPLVSIKTFLHLLGEPGSSREGEASALDPRSEPEASEGGWQRDFREVAIEELRRIERLLELVSQHARPPSAASAEAIAEVEPAMRSVAQLVTLRAVDRGIAVELELADSLAPARIGGDALRQILLNLALNAIEATPGGGSVRMQAAEREGGIEIALEDEGPGVPEAMRARLFEPFVTTKARPGGLGLAITRRLVEDAGGSIDLEPREPRGSRFRVRLPLARS